MLHNLYDYVTGWQTLERLADSSQHIVPGHDPLVMSVYPEALGGGAGTFVRLDVDPVGLDFAGPGGRAGGRAK